MSALNIVENLKVVDNQVFANSLFIAKVFKKSHKDVLKSIENLPQDEFNALLLQYHLKKGKQMNAQEIKDFCKEQGLTYRELGTYWDE